MHLFVRYRTYVLSFHPLGLSSGRSRHRDLRSFTRLIAQQSSTLDMEKKIDADSAL